MDEKEKKATSMQSLYDKLRQEDERCSEALKVAQRRFEAISMGNFVNEVKKSLLPLDIFFASNLRLKWISSVN